MEVLCATDGSKGSLAGPRALATLPLDSASRIRLLTVLERGEANPVAWKALDAAEDTLAESAAKVSRSIRRGGAVAQLLDAAGEVVAEAARSGSEALVVVGSQGRTGLERFFLGSVAERIARHAPCPTLVARPFDGPLNAVLIADDGSADADRAVHWLCRLPLPHGCRVTLTSVLTGAERDGGEGIRQRVEVSAEQLRAAGKDATVAEVRVGDPASELLAAAQACRADLIVVGARGIGGLDRMLLGSVSEKLVRHARASVLVVREANHA